jgi:hypothetical protein
MLVLFIMLIMVSCGGSDRPKQPPVIIPPPPPPPCELSVEWVNPTEDTNDNPLGANDLIAATVYFFRIPEEPREADMIHAAEAYLLGFTYVGPPSDTGIQYFIWMTVSNENGESDESNQISRICE